MFSTRPIVSFSVKHPWLIIAAAVAVTVILAVPMANLKIQADVQSLLPEEVDGYEGNLSATEEPLDMLLIMVKGKDLYTVENLQLFEQTFKQLNEILPVINTADPFSTMTLEKSGGRLMAVTLSPGGKAPADEEALEVFKQRLDEARFAPGMVSSFDGDALAFYLVVEKTDSYLAQMEEIDAVLAPLREALEVTVTGTSPFSAETERFLTQGFARLLVFVLLTILASYYLGFRSKRAVFLPVTLIISGTVFALGIMSLCGFELTMVSIISPPLILTLGSSYSIHVMNAYFAASSEKKDKKQLIIESVSGVSGTVLLASATTLIGLMSLMFATIPQTRQFAVSTALGVFFSALLSVTLLPAFLALQSVPGAKKLEKLRKDPLSKFLNRFGPRLVKSWKITIAVIIVITAVFLILTPRLKFNTSPSKYFPDSSKVIMDLHDFLGEMGGYEEFTINLKGPEDNYFLKQDVLENVNLVENELRANPDISYIFSFPQYLDFASYVMTGEENNFGSKGLNRFVAKMFSSVDPDNSYVNKEMSELNIMLRVYNSSDMMPIDEKDTSRFAEKVSSLLNDNLSDQIEWKLEGTSLGFLKLSEQMRRDFLVSTLAALILIGITSSIAFRSAVKGLLTLIPLLMGIFSSMILMVIFGIPLDMTTIMVSCITIGVGVDDSIHFLLQHKKYAGMYPDDEEKAVQQTLIHTGRPIVITTLSIVAGLVFLSFATFQPIRYFGLLIVFTLLTACFSTIVLLPSLTKLTGSRKIKSSSEPLG